MSRLLLLSYMTAGSLAHDAMEVARTESGDLVEDEEEEGKRVVDLITARIVSPSATVSLSFFMYREFTASTLAYPFALASNVLHDTSGDRAPSSAKPVVLVGDNIKFAATTIAQEQSPCWRA